MHTTQMKMPHVHHDMTIHSFIHTPGLHAGALKENYLYDPPRHFCFSNGHAGKKMYICPVITDTRNILAAIDIISVVKKAVKTANDRLQYLMNVRGCDSCLALVFDKRNPHEKTVAEKYIHARVVQKDDNWRKVFNGVVDMFYDAHLRWWFSETFSQEAAKKTIGYAHTGNLNYLDGKT